MEFLISKSMENKEIKPTKKVKQNNMICDEFRFLHFYTRGYKPLENKNYQICGNL